MYVKNSSIESKFTMRPTETCLVEIKNTDLRLCLSDTNKGNNHEPKSFKH